MRQQLESWLERIGRARRECGARSGEKLDRVPGALAVHFAPGHTRGHVLFQLNGVVFAGDAIVARDP